MTIPINFHNSFSGKLETLQTLEPGKIKMYVCGITPYDSCHLGHARCYVVFDTIRRFLQVVGYEVTYVQNFTDIDDKIISRAQNLGKDPIELAEFYIQDYFIKMEQLNVLQANAYPRVTKMVPQIIEFIQKIIDRGLAYETDGNVWYSVRKFAAYGKLSKRNLDDMIAGARVATDEQKQDPLDFALWKKAKPGEPFWTSPWGNGRPGWHIECSVMSSHHLGETFDIHGGGQDLIFPHHENEIAQSCAASGKEFARYWIHNGFVTLNKEKMSKSLGNVFGLAEILETTTPAALRFFLLSRHYHSPIDFSQELLTQSKSALYSLQEVRDLALFICECDPNYDHVDSKFFEDFTIAMSQDFNTEKAISILFALRTKILESIKLAKKDDLLVAYNTLCYLCQEVLGISLETKMSTRRIDELKEIVERRNQARLNKDWQTSDRIRRELEDSGFCLDDTPMGALVKSKPIL